MNKFKEYLDRMNVEGVEQRGRKFVFRCPVCGDSERVHTKKRGFLLTSDNKYGTIGCLKCGYKNSFIGFLKEYNNDLYNSWKYDLYENVFSVEEEFVDLNLDTEQPNSNEVVDYSLFIPITINNGSRTYRNAIEFVKNRRIPLKHAKNFLYCCSGRYSDRIIIPHYNEDMTYTYFDARDLSNRSKIRYLYPSGWSSSRYNAPNVDMSKDYFVFEGVIDSMFLDNSCACGGVQKYEMFFKNTPTEFHKNAIIFADGDSAGIDASFNLLKKGFRVVKWTNEMLNFRENISDLNGLVMNGFFKKEMFNQDGTVKHSAVMDIVVQPTLSELILSVLTPTRFKD